MRLDRLIKEVLKELNHNSIADYSIEELNGEGVPYPTTILYVQVANGADLDPFRITFSTPSIQKASDEKIKEVLWLHFNNLVHMRN